MTFHELSPAALGINGADMKAAANTEYTSGILDLRVSTELLVMVTVAETGSPTAGAAQVLFQPVDESDTNLGPQVALATAMSTQVDGQTAKIAMGGGLAATAVNATVGADVDKHMRPLGRGKLILEVTTANNGTTSTASMRAWHK